MTVDLAPAIQLFRAGRLVEAERLCRQALAIDPLQATTLNLRGVALFQLGRAAEAAAPLRRAARLAPQAAEVFLTNLLAVGGDAATMTSACRHMLALQPASGAAFGRMAVTAQRRGDLDAACAAIGRAVRLSPESLQDWMNRTLLLQADGRLEEAMGAVRRLLALAPGDPGAVTTLGTLLLVQGDAGAALPVLLRACRLDPASPTTAQALERCTLLLQPARRAGDAAAPEGLLVRGALSPVSGYGHMTCRFLERLVGVPGRPVQAVGVFGPERWPGADAPVRARVGLHFLIPPAVEPAPGTRTVVFSMFEGTRIPPPWRRYSDRHDLVVVPCESSRRAWIDQGFPEDRLRLCPLGVDPAPAPGPALGLADRRGRPVASYRHRILNVSDFIPRKNVDGLLRVWLAATRADDDAVLVLKLGKGSPESRAAIAALLARTEAAVGRRWDEAAALAIVDQRLDEPAMDGLFRACTAYWSLSHGEGWDLPLTKAGALGMGLIAPRHSAYEDYLDETVARMIPARVEPAGLPYGGGVWAPFFGLDWWTPDEEAAAAIVADVVRDRGAPLPDARPRLLGRFTWTHAAARLEAILDEAAGAA